MFFDFQKNQISYSSGATILKNSVKNDVGFSKYFSTFVTPLYTSSHNFRGRNKDQSKRKGIFDVNFFFFFFFKEYRYLNRRYFGTLLGFSGPFALLISIPIIGVFLFPLSQV